MCTSTTRPDFNAEEVASVTKDQKELVIIVEDMADHLPIEDPNKGKSELMAARDVLSSFFFQL